MALFEKLGEAGQEELMRFLTYSTTGFYNKADSQTEHSDKHSSFFRRLIKRITHRDCKRTAIHRTFHLRHSLVRGRGGATHG